MPCVQRACDKPAVIYIRGRGWLCRQHVTLRDLVCELDGALAANKSKLPKGVYDIVRMMSADAANAKEVKRHTETLRRLAAAEKRLVEMADGWAATQREADAAQAENRALRGMIIRNVGAKGEAGKAKMKEGAK